MACIADVLVVPQIRVLRKAVCPSAPLRNPAAGGIEMAAETSGNFLRALKIAAVANATGICPLAADGNPVKFLGLQESGMVP